MSKASIVDIVLSRVVYTASLDLFLIKQAYMCCAARCELYLHASILPPLMKPIGLFLALT